MWCLWRIKKITLSFAKKRSGIVNSSVLISLVFPTNRWYRLQSICETCQPCCTSIASSNWFDPQLPTLELLSSVHILLLGIYIPFLCKPYVLISAKMALWGILLYALEISNNPAYVSCSLRLLLVTVPYKLIKRAKIASGLRNLAYLDSKMFLTQEINESR